MVVGMGLVFLYSVKLSNLFPIVVFLALGIATLILKPYIKRIHNIRFTCNMTICIVIQIIYLTYKLSTNS